jgi:hypothetical protein
LGANAVIGMQFEHREVGEMWMEMCAYGTAVIAYLAADKRPPDRPLVAAETAHPATIAPEPPGVAEPASAPNLRSAPETPTPPPSGS